jgi:hypothetical protein
MFARSAAADTQQGRATQRVNEQWGSDALRRAPGRESLAIAVCKKKYAPFCFPVVTTEQEGGTATTTTTVQVQRRLGCRLHHPHRVAVIQQHGLRAGWEPFGQWSRQKAHELARRETRKRKRLANAASSSSSSTAAGEDTTPFTTEDEVSSLSSSEQMAVCSRVDTSRSLCWNGNCLWKHPSRFDDVEEEIRQGLLTVVPTSEGATETPANTSAARTKRRPSPDSKPPPR